MWWYKSQSNTDRNIVTITKMILLLDKIVWFINIKKSLMHKHLVCTDLIWWEALIWRSLWCYLVSKCFWIRGIPVWHLGSITLRTSINNKDGDCACVYRNTLELGITRNMYMHHKNNQTLNRNVLLILMLILMLVLSYFNVILMPQMFDQAL